MSGAASSSSTRNGRCGKSSGSSASACPGSTNPSCSSCSRYPPTSRSTGASAQVTPSSAPTPAGTPCRASRTAASKAGRPTPAATQADATRSRPIAPASPAPADTLAPPTACSHAARSSASRSRRETNARPSPYSSHRSRTQAPNAATVTPMSEQPPSAALFLYATARSVSGSSTTSYAIEVSMPDILAHPLSAFSPIHGTYPKFRRAIEPMPAPPPRISPKPRNPSARADRARRGDRPRYRRRRSPSPQLRPRCRARSARRPAALSGDRPSKSDLSLDRKPQHGPNVPRQSSCQRKRGAALDGRTIRRRTWPSGAPGDRNARWRPSRCARTARRRAPGTRGSDGCNGPRS